MQDMKSTYKKQGLAFVDSPQEAFFFLRNRWEGGGVEGGVGGRIVVGI